MIRPKVLTAILAFSLTGCQTAAPPSGPPYLLHADVKQVMKWILDPATDAIWGSAGTIITAEGRTELAPTTDESWDRVRSNAVIVVETANLLMLPGRARGPEWIASARALGQAGVLAMQAAEAKAPDALFDAGGKLYVACVGCHDRYWPADD